ncbi:hypothetical protein FACS1894200_01410 [Spirochaetia bacterium]|nr:hypothetical protein FACS1894200_01410 [Spirochaetia bacterium]
MTIQKTSENQTGYRIAVDVPVGQVVLPKPEPTVLTESEKLDAAARILGY